MNIVLVSIDEVTGMGTGPLQSAPSTDPMAVHAVAVSGIGEH